MSFYENIRQNLDRLYNFSWYSLVFMLLFTSLPLLASLIRTDSVAPPAVMAAVLLFVIWLIPQVFKGIKFPFLTLPFLATISVFLIVTGISFFQPTLPVKGRLPISESLDAFITLTLAVIVYLVSSTFPNTNKKLENSLKLINISGVILILWSAMQIFFIFTVKGAYPDWMRSIQSLFSIRILFHNRVTGFAYEPSWLAHQLNMVFLPYWLAATVKGFSVQNKRIWKFTLENLLLFGGVIVLALSFSRIGWISFGLAFSIVVLQQTTKLTNTIQEWILRKRSPRLQTRKGLNILIFVLFLGAYVGAGVGAIEIAGRFDNRLADFFSRAAGSESFYQFTNRLAFAERTVYWGTGWEIFNDHPITGVGLGKAGFFFNEEMPSFAWLLNEIKDIYFRQPYLFNTKNLWTRLLAETGTVGFVFFLTWMYLMWKSARTMQKSENPLLGVMGWTGMFFIVGFSIEGFSIDSFALPYIWFAAGICTAATHLYLGSGIVQGEPRSDEQPV